MKIRKIKDNQGTNRPWKLSKTLPRFPFLMTMFAQKGSGKSTVLYNIINQGVTKDDYVMVFSTSIHTEPKLRMLKEWMEKKGIEHDYYDEFQTQTPEGLVDHIVNYTDQRKLENERLIETTKALKATRELLASLKNEKKTSKHQRKEPRSRFNIIRSLPGTDESDYDPISEAKQLVRDLEIQEKALKKAVNRRAFCILDDMDTSARNKSVTHLTKTHRRYNMAIIQCGHDPCELVPGARAQIDYLLMFQGMNPNIINKLFDAFTFLKFSKREFLDFYEDITKKKYTFLFFDKIEGEFRKNFDTPLKIAFVRN